MREKTVPRLPNDYSVHYDLRGVFIKAEHDAPRPICCVCQMPMRDEKPCHWIGDDPMHKDCVGPSIVGVRKG